MKRLRGAAVVAVLSGVLLAGCSGAGRNSAFCGGGEVQTLILMAQAVPSATWVPCISELPAGWSYGGDSIANGKAQFWLDSDRAGVQAVTVTLTESCDVGDAVEVPVGSEEPGITRYEDPQSLPPHFTGNRYDVFDGGCVTYRFDFAKDSSSTLVFEADNALSMRSRTKGAQELFKDGIKLCGAGIPPCPG